jgi:hypothetical protein
VFRLPHRNFSPTVVVLVDSHAFASFDALKEPGCDDFGRRVFEAFYFIEKVVIDFFDERHDFSINFGKIPHKAARIEFPAHDDIDPIIVPVHIFALVAFRQEREVMG